MTVPKSQSCRTQERTTPTPAGPQKLVRFPFSTRRRAHLTSGTHPRVPTPRPTASPLWEGDELGGGTTADRDGEGAGPEAGN